MVDGIVDGDLGEVALGAALGGGSNGVLETVLAVEAAEVIFEGLDDLGDFL